MTAVIQDMGVSYGPTAAAHSLFSLSATNPSNTLVVTLNPTTIAFRNTTLTTGTPVVVSNATDITLTISATDSFGLVTANGSQRIAILAINNGGVIELAASALYGGVSLDETGVITTSTSATTATSIEAAAVRTGVAYKVVGFVDATFTTSVGWGSLVKVQGQGGQALAAMSSLGYGQTWQNVAGSRAIGTTYYNTTSKPILVAYSNAGASSQAAVTVGGVGVGTVGSTSLHTPFSFVVPSGQSYIISTASGTPNIATWAELR